jgi:hypothetical protein
MGPTGLQGPEGPEGPAGPQGEQGPPGVGVKEIYFAALAVSGAAGLDALGGGEIVPGVSVTVPGLAGFPAGVPLLVWDGVDGGAANGIYVSDETSTGAFLFSVDQLLQITNVGAIVNVAVDLAIGGANAGQPSTYWVGTNDGTSMGLRAAGGGALLAAVPAPPDPPEPSEAYSPADAQDWPSPTPTTWSTALDALASRDVRLHYVSNVSLRNVDVNSPTETDFRSDRPALEPMRTYLLIAQDDPSENGTWRTGEDTSVLVEEPIQPVPGDSVLSGQMQWRCHMAPGSTELEFLAVHEQSNSGLPTLPEMGVPVLGVTHVISGDQTPANDFPVDGSADAQAFADTGFTGNPAWKRMLLVQQSDGERNGLWQFTTMGEAPTRIDWVGSDSLLIVSHPNSVAVGQIRTADGQLINGGGGESVAVPGPTGPAGPQGPAGPEGPAGDTGPAGPQGPAGATGAQGPEGPEGPAGPTGAAGPAGPEGPQGPAGPEGPTGPQGPSGPTGATGATGQSGVAATIQIGTVITNSNPSTPATVTNVGTTSAAVFDFELPRGATGSPGANGAAATIEIGAVSTLPPGSAVSVENVGSTTAAILDIGIPQGATGQDGAGGVPSPYITTTRVGRVWIGGDTGQGTAWAANTMYFYPVLLAPGTYTNFINYGAATQTAGNGSIEIGVYEMVSDGTTIGARLSRGGAATTNATNERIQTNLQTPVTVTSAPKWVWIGFRSDGKSWNPSASTSAPFQGAALFNPIRLVGGGTLEPTSISAGARGAYVVSSQASAPTSGTSLALSTTLYPMFPLTYIGVS